MDGADVVQPASALGGLDVHIKAQSQPSCLIADAQAVFRSLVLARPAQEGDHVLADAVCARETAHKLLKDAVQ
jgi:hypothetical protein